MANDKPWYQSKANIGAIILGLAEIIEAYFPETKAAMMSIKGMAIALFGYGMRSAIGRK